MKFLRKIILLLMLAISMSAFSNNEFFKTLNASNGLTSSLVNCILKDSRGFVWFGTPSGLYRYDGYYIKHFQSDSQDGSSLSDSYIIGMQEAMDGNLWIETPMGYCIYHPQTESFERDMRHVFANMGIASIPKLAYIDRYHNIWCYMPNQGVVCYNMQQQMIYDFSFSGSSSGNYGIPKGEICSIGECKDGAVLVYDDGLLICCDVMHQQSVLWTSDEVAQKQLRKTTTLKVFADQTDNLWLYGQGTLFHFNKKTKTWDTTIGNSIGMIGTATDNGVNSMSGDRSGNIWIATNRNGLIKMNVNTHEMEPVIMGTLQQSRLQHSTGIQYTYVDDTDLLWVGTARAGVAYWGANIYKFNIKTCGDITAIAEDANGNMIYGTSEDGILDSNVHLASQKVTAMTYTLDGSLWVGSKQNGLTRIKDGVTTYFDAVQTTNKKGLIDNHINALCSDKSGNLWIATDGGVQMYNTKMGTFSNYTKENGKLKVNKVTALFYSKSNNEMLIGTSEGLTIMRISTTEVRHLTGNSTNIKKFTNNYITFVFLDSRGLIWVGTREGVNILNPHTDDLKILTEREGLCNNSICGIAEDKNKNIWITTSYGVTRIVAQPNHEEGTFDFGLYNYNLNDGLQSNEFNLGAIFTKRNGTVVMGGLNGVNWARPKSIEESGALHKVMLTQLFLGEEEVLTGHSYDDNVILPQALNESNIIVLNNSQNTFTIKFAAGNYNQSERLQFKYWLEGLDQTWRNGNALDHGVTFTNLKSGKYMLHVKAVSAEGAISKQECTLEIVVRSPWYFQWYMLLFYAVLLIITLYLWKKGINQLKAVWAKKRELLNELAIQREEIKMASNDLKQPMARMTSIIMNLSEKEGGTLEEREQLNTLHSQMLQIITRVSEMQSALEHPEQSAKQQVNKHYELNSHGEMNLPDSVSAELTSEIKSQLRDSPTSKVRIMFIDNNDDFIRFVDARLRYVYDFHSYNDIISAMADVEVTIPDLIVCKHDMQPVTGSDFCNKIKSDPKLDRIKFVLMTEDKMSAQQMSDLGITLAADDYLNKPFNLQEVAMRFNKLMGIGYVEITSNLIEGAETRMLEGRNSSMTTSTETINHGSFKAIDQDDPNDEMHSVDIHFVKQEYMGDTNDGNIESSEYSMNNAMDRQLITNIEQYVQQNMSRGQINLEEMAQAMGMGVRPLFMKVRDITGKSPAEVVKDIRLKHACILLKRTNINMTELAANIGFTTAESFITAFKEKFNLLPSEYRQKYRE